MQLEFLFFPIVFRCCCWVNSVPLQPGSEAFKSRMLPSALCDRRGRLPDGLLGKFQTFKSKRKKKTLILKVRMCQAALLLPRRLLLLTLCCLLAAQDRTKVSFTCPENQQLFRGSCFEFVSLRRSFVAARAWCERRGGHLAFISDEETQRFVQSRLDPKADAWLGAASSASGEGKAVERSETPNRACCAHRVRGGG